jgi:hypothetical protein
MKVDGCDTSVEALVLEVFPRYLELLLRAAREAPVSMSYAASPGVGPVKLRQASNVDADFAGCYALFEAGQPIYVGISRRVFQRLSDHVKGSDHFTATLAYHMAKDHHPHGKTAAGAMADPTFSQQFQAKREYVASLTAGFVAIANPFELYLFEPYAAMKLGTGKDDDGWNTFITH